VNPLDWNALRAGGSVALVFAIPFSIAARVVADGGDSKGTASLLSLAALVGFVLLPMVVPPVVSAITLYFLLTSISGMSSFFGYDTWLGVAMAHSVMTVPFATVLILVSLSQLDRRIDLAARGLGATVWERATRIIVPNIKFGIITAALLSFVLSWEEIGVTLFITSVNAITLPRLMWMGLRDNIDPAIAALSVILIIITVLVLAVRSVVSRQRAGH